MLEQGELAELIFITEASKRGMHVSIPFGSSSKYDAVIDNGKCLVRIQVKSVAAANKIKKYSANVHHGKTVKQTYDKDCIDFFAVYVIPLSLWYIIPVTEVSTFSIQLSPHTPMVDTKDMKYEKYRSKWSLLKKWNCKHK